MKKLIVANWKMYPKSAKEALSMFSALQKNIHSRRSVDVVIAPPFVYLSLASGRGLFMLGAQDVFWESEGSFTGEVSPGMLKGFGVRYVIVGHSERRKYMGETDEMINKKIKSVLMAGMHALVCVGEEKRDKDGAFYAVIKNQLIRALKGVRKNQLSRVVVAYEPIWAIGKEKPASVKDAAEAALFIKKVVARLYGVSYGHKLRVLYGGSVKAENAGEFLKERDIAGLLVGRESRIVKEFAKIVQCASRVS